MDFYINLRVNFRGNSKNFLLSGSETKSWESMEAMVRGEGLLSSGGGGRSIIITAPSDRSLPVVAVDIGVSLCGCCVDCQGHGIARVHLPRSAIETLLAKRAISIICFLSRNAFKNPFKCFYLSPVLNVAIITK